MHSVAGDKVYIFIWRDSAVETVREVCVWVLELLALETDFRRSREKAFGIIDLLS